MSNNFMLKINTTDGAVITLDMSSVDVDVYQKRDGKSVKVLELTGRPFATDPGGHQLNLDVSLVQLESDSKTLVTRIHSYKYGKGQ